MKPTLTAAILLIASVAQANPDSAVPLFLNGTPIATAVMIEGNYALTAEHVVVMGMPDRIGFSFDTVTAVNRPVLNNTDQAVLLRVGGSGPFSILSTVPPKVGDAVTTVGFPSGKRTALSGLVTRVTSTFRGNTTKGLTAAYSIETDILTQSGHSGAGLWNSDGELIGLLSNTAIGGVDKKRVLPSQWIGMPSILKAVAHKNQRRVIVLSASYCEPCKLMKADPRTKDWLFVNADTQPKEYARHRANFEAQLRAKGEPVPKEVYPTVFVEGTALFVIGKSVEYILGWVGKVVISFIDPVLPPDQQVRLPDAPPREVAPPRPYVRSEDSRIEGLLGTVEKLKEDIKAGIATAKDAKKTADGLKDAGIIGKVKGIKSLKSDLADMKARVANIKDGATELKDAFSDPVTYLPSIWAIVMYLYHRRKEAIL